MAKRQSVRKASLIIMFLLFPIVIFYFSPYLIILGALKGIATGSVIMFTLQFVLSLFFGRALCGFACPTGGLQECLMLANGKKAKGGKLNWIKYVIWVPWLTAIVVLFVRAGGVRKVDFLFHTTNGISISEPFTYFIYYGVILLIVILSLTAGRRAFCHYVCWMSPFMVIGTKISKRLKIPSLHIKADNKACISCDRCSGKCPMSLDVGSMVKEGAMQSSECILCGECIDICPKKAISYDFGVLSDSGKK